MGNILYEEPKEDFPPTGVKRVDDIINNVKKLAELALKPAKLIEEFKALTFIFKLPSDPFSDIPEPSKAMLTNPDNAIALCKTLITQYENMIKEYTQLGENLKTMLEGELQKTIDFLKELVTIPKIISDLLEGIANADKILNEEVEKLKKNPLKFCGTGKSLFYIRHNLKSLEKLKNKYAPELNTAKEYAEKGQAKLKEVEDIYKKGVELKNKFEEKKRKVENLKDKANEHIKQANELKEKANDIKNTVKNVAEDVKDVAKGTLNKIKGLF